MTTTPGTDSASPPTEPDSILRSSGLGIEQTASDTATENAAPLYSQKPPVLTPIPSESRSDPGGDVLVKSPHLSERQFIWVTYRLSTMDDLEACAAAVVSVDEVLEWRQDERFNGFLAGALEDKAKSFRDLTSHLLPETSRAMWRLLTEGNLKDQAKGVALILRHQGLFVDTVRVEDQAAIASLLDRLRSRQPVTINDVTPRE